MAQLRGRPLLNEHGLYQEGVSQMTIAAVLQKVSKPALAQDHTTVYRHGAIEPDHDPDYFRIYNNPKNRRSYSLVRKSDLVGDIYELTPEETVQAGFVGTTIYRIPLKIGSDIQHVSVKVHRLEGDVCCCGTACTQCSTSSQEDCDSVGGTVCPNHC
jgi:hypothetical protein